MRKLAYLGNVILIALIAYIMTEVTRDEFGRAMFLVFILSLPMINIYALWDSDGGKLPDAFERLTTLCGLHFERMQLEQERRIAELKKESGK